MAEFSREGYVAVDEAGRIYRDGSNAAVDAVSRVSFTVPRGQFVAVLGPSGSG
jgi:ABC-type lipoprotein export system ATPase subunit